MLIDPSTVRLLIINTGNPTPANLVHLNFQNFFFMLLIIHTHTSLLFSGIQMIRILTVLLDECLEIQSHIKYTSVWRDFQEVR